MKSNIYIFTIGHGAKPLQVFLNKLKEYKIQVLCDIRTYPVSRFYPHFNKMPLHKALATETIKYLFRGANLGGRAENVDYEEAIDELVALAKQGIRVCVMCSEGSSYLKCHRYTKLTPSFETRGLLVVHIEYENEKRNSKHK